MQDGIASGQSDCEDCVGHGGSSWVNLRGDFLMDTPVSCVY